MTDKCPGCGKEIKNAKKKASLPSLEESDKDMAKELYLWEENTDDLTERNGQAWRRNFLKKFRNGTYDHDLAVYGIMVNYVHQIVDSYNKNNEIGMKIGRATKRAVAEFWVSTFETEAKLGNYDNLIKKHKRPQKPMECPAFDRPRDDCIVGAYDKCKDKPCSMTVKRK